MPTLGREPDSGSNATVSGRRPASWHQRPLRCSRYSRTRPLADVAAAPGNDSNRLEADLQIGSRVGPHRPQFVPSEILAPKSGN